MIKLQNFLNYIAHIDSFARVALLIILVIYTFFALILAFQIFSFNRLMEQENFAGIFKFFAIIHVTISFILLVIVLLSL